MRPAIFAALANLLFYKHPSYNMKVSSCSVGCLAYSISTVSKYLSLNMLASYMDLVVR